MAQNSLKNKFNQLEKKIDTKDSQDSWESTPSHSHPKVKDLEDKKFILSQDVESLIEGEYDLQNNPEYIKHYIQELKVDINRLENKKKRLKKSIPFFFRGRLKKLQKHQTKLLTQKEEIGKLVTLLERDVQKQDHNHSQYRTEVNDLKFAIETLKERKSFLIKEKEKLAYNFVRLKEELAEGQARISQLRKEASNLENTNKMLQENAKVLEGKRNQQNSTISHLHGLKDKSKNSEVFSSEIMDLKVTTQKTYHEAALPSIQTKKLDSILETYTEGIKPNMPTETDGLDKKQLKSFYEKDIKAFNLLMKTKTELDVLLTQYDFENSGLFSIDFQPDNQVAILELKNISIEKDILNQFFSKRLKEAGFSDYKSPSRVYRYTANNLVKELKFKFNLEKNVSKPKLIEHPHLNN